MKKLLNLSAFFAILATSCIAVVSCDSKGTGTGTEPELQLATTITFVSATENTVTVDIVPEKDALGYNYAIGNSTDLNSFLDGTMEGIKTQNDPTVKSATFEGLTDNTTYTVFAQAFAGEEKGRVRTLQVTTAEGVKDLTLEMSLNAPTEDAIIVNVKYSEDVEEIVYGFGTADDQEAFENGTLATIATKKATGAGTLIVNGMERGKEYTIFAQAVAGNEKGNVATVTARTYKLEIELVLVEGSLTSTGASIEIRPGGDTDKYRYTLGSMDIKDMFEDGTWLDVQWENDATKVKTTVATGLKPNTEYTVFVQPFAENSTRGKTEWLTFTTLPEE